MLLGQNLYGLQVYVLLQFDVDLASFVQTVMPIFSFIALQCKSSYDHVKIIQVYAMQSVLLLFQFNNQSISQERLTHHLIIWDGKQTVIIMGLNVKLGLLTSIKNDLDAAETFFIFILVNLKSSV